MLTSVTLRRTRGASRVKKHPRPAWARRSKPSLSEYRLVAGIERANSQVMPTTCSRAVAVDGSAIGRRRRRIWNVCLKRLISLGCQMQPVKATAASQPLGLKNWASSSLLVSDGRECRSANTSPVGARECGQSYTTSYLPELSA